MPTEPSSIFFTNLEEFKKSLDEKPKADHQVLNFKNEDSLGTDNDDSQWFAEDYEGQLAVDVYQTKDNIIVKATIAGIKPEDLEIYIHNDLLTIRGKREQSVEHEEVDYFYKECYWGGFSRSIILPVEVQVDKIQATLKNGILTIILPKSHKSKLINIEVKTD